MRRAKIARDGSLVSNRSSFAWEGGNLFRGEGMVFERDRPPERQSATLWGDVEPGDSDGKDFFEMNSSRSSSPLFKAIVTRRPPARKNDKKLRRLRNPSGRPTSAKGNGGLARTR